MTYDTLRNAYIESRGYLTEIIKYSEKLGLEDSRIFYLLQQEGFLGENIFRMLADIKSIQSGNKGFLITSKALGSYKKDIWRPLGILRGDAERMEEVLEVANDNVDEDIKKAITAYCHSLNKIEDILVSPKLEDLLKQIE